MSRAAQTKAKLIIATIVIVVAGAVAGAWGWNAYSSAHQAHVVVNAAHETTQLSYKGQNDTSALTLLKRYARVQTKHYSFGDMVTAIDGTPGDGPKYWVFYVNGKEASVGAGAYITKNSDTVVWKLQ